MGFRPFVYRVASQLGLVSQPGGPALEASALDPGIPEASSESDASIEREIEVPVQGMWCSSCAWLIERVLLKRRGVISCRVQFVTDTARIRYNPRYVSRQEVLDQIADLGYKPGAPGSNATDQVQRELLIRLGVATAPAMYMMMFNVILYQGYFIRLDPQVRHFLQTLLMFLSLPIVTWCAWPIYRKAWAAFRQGGTTMETLITLGAGSAFGYSVYATIMRQAQVYYDTAAMIITLVLLGKYLEAVARSRATAAVGSLSAMLPKKVRVQLPDGDERLVTADQVQVGDRVIVDSGASIPVDGVVVDGVAAVDESLLTGEAIPVRRGPGDAVVGASLCVEGGIVIEALRVGGGTTISRMATVVRDAMATRSTSEKLADRVSRIFVPLIAAAAGVVFAHQLLLHTPVPDALMRAVSVLVVACPCALGMATPLAIAAAMGSAARRGILVRNSQSLEKARAIDTVILDKTGTVTTGRLQVVDVLMVEGEPDAREWQAISSLESLSQHPAARAIVAWIRQCGYLPRADVEMEILPGKGVRGRVGTLPVFVGAAEAAPPLGEDVERRVAEAEAQGRTVVVAACDGKAICAFVLGDVPRPGAGEAIRTMQTAGIDVWLVSGDSAVTTNAVGDRLGIKNVISRALPDDKIERVRKLKKSGRCVAMVGDGINDGPALAEADFGIAMGEGTQLALEAADMALLSPDLRRIPYALGLSNKVVRIIRQNLFWALAYNVLIIPAAAGWYGPRLAIGPLFAAFAMLISSLSVVFNSMRLQE